MVVLHDGMFRNSNLCLQHCCAEVQQEPRNFRVAMQTCLTGRLEMRYLYIYICMYALDRLYRVYTGIISPSSLLTSSKMQPEVVCVLDCRPGT